MPRSLDEWLTYIDGVHPRDIDMGLERVTRVAERIGVVRPAPQTVVVAGTNGKGSTSVALERLLLAAGLRVGTTLSPHVSRFNERIRVAGAQLDDAAICALFAAIDEARGEVALTYFEYSALAALLAFRDAGVDAAILEIGLGGRLDAFNLVDADLAIVTSIGLDHEDYLGSDLEAIGREKAGVFRRGKPVVLGHVTRSVETAAAELDCPAYQLGRDFYSEEDASSWQYRGDMLGMRFEALRRGVLAPCNCALALTAACLLTGRRDLAAEQLATVTLAGRMEAYNYRGAQVIVDVAHNPAAAAFLAEQLGQRFPGRRFVAVYGALADKDAAGVVQALGARVSKWLTIPTGGWRGQAADRLADRIGVAADACESLPVALDKALSFTGSGDGILAFGSFSAVEQARTLLSERHRPDSVESN